MALEVDLSLVSPSSIGKYAICTDRLRRDTLYPQPRRPSGPPADFGTVCHYYSMQALGALGIENVESPKVKAEGRIWKNALKLKPFDFADDDEMIKHAKKCATVANSRVPILPEGVRWRCEVSKYDDALLPKRVGRKGQKGFGGDVDLLSENNAIIIDYKFVGKLPERVKAEYLWQMASYSILRDVNETIVIHVQRETLQTASFSFKWKETKKWSVFRDQVRKFIERLGHANFMDYCYPVFEADNCEYCEHKDDCPAFTQVAPTYDNGTTLAPAMAPSVANEVLARLGGTAKPAFFSSEPKTPQSSLASIAAKTPAPASTPVNPGNFFGNSNPPPGLLL